VQWDLSKLGGRRDGIVEDNVVQEIDVATGAVLFEWHALGTIHLDESIRAAPQKHDAQRAADGTITLFDNVAEDLPARGRRSRGLSLRLDPRERTASVARWWEHPDALLSPTQGSMQALEGGGAFVGWGGSQPVFSEFSADGRTVFDARFTAKAVESYRAYRAPWTGAGEGRPAAVARSDGRRITVHASWNGATGVTAWRVRSPDGRTATAPRAGFETAIRLEGDADQVEVDALGDDRRVLGTAEAVPVAQAAAR
jgi:hypothetical protein